MDINKKCEILSQLWYDFKGDEQMEDFFDYNDFGLPMACFVHEEIFPISPRAEIYISETFDLLIAALELDIEKEYESLDEMLFEAGKG
jgi:hypothetical protein